MNTLLRDLRYALRKLLRQPGFLAVTVLTLALGIGATTTVFSWVQMALLRPFPGTAHSDRLVVLCTRHGTAQYDTCSLPNLQDLERKSDVFEGVIGSQVTPACLSVDGRQEWIYGQIATGNFFEVLGMRPAQGRFFTGQDGTAAGSAPVLVLSHGFWQRRFGGNPGVVGRGVVLNQHPFTIIGVAPEEFPGTMGGLACDFWAPVAMFHEVAGFGTLDGRGIHWLHAIARLRPGVELAQAQAAVSLQAHQLQQAYPGENREIDFNVLPPYKSPWGGQSLFLPLLSVLMAVSFGVLLIVVANVANLLLARALSRQREMAVRLAIGAGRGQLVRQLMIESLLLASLGGIGGWLVSLWGTGLLRLFVPTTYLPVRYTFHVDGLTLGFTAVVTLVTGALFGLAPALQAARTSLAGVLKEGARGSGTSHGHLRLRGALVVSEIALALVLLAGAGLCLKGFQKARQVDPGFDPSHTLLAGLRLSFHGYTESSGKVFYRQLRERLAALPGVKEAALASWFPLGFEGGPSTGVEVEGYQRAPNEDTSVQYAIVSPHYLAAMRTPLVRGRDFTDQDNERSAPVVIINEAVARRFWPGQEALGKVLTVFGDRKATVVGVVPTGKYRSLNEPPKPFLYVPFEQGVWDLNLGIVVRTEGAPLQSLTAVRQAVKAQDSNVELWTAISYADYISAAFMTQGIASVLLLVLAAVALALAALGIYAVMAWLVGQRTHEIGVRMALGARMSDVLRMMLVRGMRLAGLGVLVGLAGAAAGSRLLAAFLHGVSPWDPLVFLGVAAALGAVAFLACLLPALEAARVDPVVALRQE